MHLQLDDTPEDDESTEAISLEELSQTYVNLVNKASAEDGLTQTTQAPNLNLVGAEDSPANDKEQVQHELLSTDDSSNVAVTPRTIVEAVLFVGRPDNRGITAAEIAGLMRGVQEPEIADWVKELNEIYRDQHRALQIIEGPDGYRLHLAPHAEEIRERFYGRVRAVSLSQSAIDCLALIAYQPGISRQQLDDQRGQPSGGVLNQLVRRQLIEIRREDADGKPITHYYPTDKLVQLAGLSSLEDLPQVEEFE